MNERIKDLWIDALTSGEFVQGRARLRSGNEFCCLGILCELYRRETGQGKWRDGGDVCYFDAGSGDLAAVQALSPPLAVITWAGLDTVQSTVGDIAEWNDGTDPFDYADDARNPRERTPPLSFDTIAELIRDFV